MGDDTEFIKLPLEERCTHKLWKARLHGYTEAAKLFEEQEDEKAPLFGQFVGLVGKIVGDSNAAAQEKGLEAVLLFVQHAAVAGKTVKDVMSVIVSKCIAAPKARTKELSVQIALMYIEIEKQDHVVEELVKGMEHKNPKIVAACIAALTASLREFGSKVIGIKPLIKLIGSLLEDRDKSVRDETKAMIVEIFRWIREAIKPQLTSLKPVQITELEAEFDKVRGEKAVPTRYLRSQQVHQAKLAAEKEENGGTVGESEEAEVETCNIDPYDLMDPINILAQVPGDFYEKIEAKKWQERKEAVEALEKLLEYPKFDKGDYADLVRALMKVITKDSNVVVVGIAVKCIGRLASGLKRGFQSYSNTILPQLLEKFKEKKANVVVPLREAVDAIYPNTSLDALQEDLVSLLDNKNPAVKAETTSFLARCFTKCTPTQLNKKLLKVLTTALLKALSESDQTVRDCAAEALGTAMKVVGERAMTPLLTDLDNLKMAKIKECCEKAVVVKAPSAPSKPSTATIKAEKSKSDTVSTKPVAKPAAPKKVSSAGNVKKVTTAPAKAIKQIDREREMSQEEVDELIAELLPEDVVKGLGDSNWKTRLEAIESFTNLIKAVEQKEGAAQVLARTISKKPGLKDTNFQVLKLKLEALKHIAENFPMTSTVVEIVVLEVIDKLGDAKNGTIAAETLTAFSEATSLDFIVTQTLDYAFTQKNPKVQQEALNWVSDAIKEFGLGGQTKFLIDSVKKGLNATNVSVRTSSVSLCGTLYLYMGQQLLSLIDEKPTIMTLISAEIDKHAGEKAPPPTRGDKKMNDSHSSEESGGGGERLEEKPVEKLSDTSPRIDIGPKLSDQLISELGDKNWKVRNEALLALQNIITEARCIKPNLGELPTVLCQRIVDSNGKLVVLALEICKSIATAMGAPCKTHVRTFFRMFLTALGDSKQWVRSAALACINTWGAEGGFKEFFEGEVIPDALKTGSPTLRTELWTWLAEVLPNHKNLPREELSLCVPHLFTSLEDRSSDVRKTAQAAVLGVMMHVGYSNMVKQTEKLKPGSKTQTLALLEKIRPDLPVQAEAPKTVSKNKKMEEKPRHEVKGTPKSKATAAVKPYSRKKEEEVDTTPLLPVNNMKNQRLIDEQKLKTLRWNFTMPRSEFVDLLKEQVTTAGFNKTLISNMFHNDFKYHLKAIESLSEDLGNVDAVVANLDLILKWMTLRFFDTNPSVLLKGLEYLQNVFSMLIENEYTIFDSEANSFVPYLVLKIGDPKDAVRDRVRAILKQISLMFASGKLFTLIMDGLKSKNARQRTECLEELGNLIEEFGMSVCQPTPSAALKEISKQISDRDNSVRSAALNAIVKAWFIEGDKVYKLIGQISEKDLSLLEERVKRAAKVRPNVTIAPKIETKEEEKIPDVRANVTAMAPVEEEEYHEPPPASAQKKRGFGLNVQNLFRELDLVEPPLQKIELIEIDDSFLDSPVQIPERIAAKMSKTPGAVAPPKEDLLIEQVIREVGSPNINLAFQASSKLRLVLESQERALLTVYTDSIMDSVVTQLRLVNSYSLEKYGLILPQTYRMLFRIIDDIFGKKTSMGVAVKVSHLQILLQELLVTLVEDKTAKFAEGGYNKWISVFVSRIIEDSDHTNVTCAVIKLLYDVVGSPPQNPKVTDLTTKCLLKIIVLIKQGHSTWCELLDLDDVLFECHLFFQAYPRHTWKDRPSIVPLKAIKTLLLALVNLKGKDIFSFLRRIENPCASELSMYLKRLLKAQPTVAKTPSNMRLSRAMSDHLSEIFMKIASEETAKEGLLQFYEFKKQNPQLDLSSFLAPTSKYFQDYVENGLKNIEMERGPLKPSPKKPQEPALSLPESSNVEIVPEAAAIETGSGLAQYYLDRLRMFQARVGFQVSDLPDFKSEN